MLKKRKHKIKRRNTEPSVNHPLVLATPSAGPQVHTGGGAAGGGAGGGGAAGGAVGGAAAGGGGDKQVFKAF